MTRRKIATIEERCQHQLTWEKLKIDTLTLFTVGDLTKEIIYTIATKLDFYDSEINYCIRARRNLME